MNDETTQYPGAADAETTYLDREVMLNWMIGEGKAIRRWHVEQNEAPFVRQLFGGLSLLAGIGLVLAPIVWAVPWWLAIPAGAVVTFTGFATLYEGRQQARKRVDGVTAFGYDPRVWTDPAFDGFSGHGTPR